MEEYRYQGGAEAWCHRTSPLAKGRGGGEEDDIVMTNINCKVLVTLILNAQVVVWAMQG